jgi:hypothetical protein
MKRIVSLFAILFAFVAAQAPLHAQGGAQGTILGTMTDASGALIPGGVVTITNLDTNFSTTTKSNAEGAYSVPYLRPSQYKVQGEKEGFSKSTVDKLTLQVGQSLRVDLTLRPGQLSESISISADVAHLDTENAAIGTVVGERVLGDLPLNGRGFNQLIFLDATATTTYTETGGDSISIAGARASSNMYLLDGQSINIVRYQNLGVVPSLDVIQEFKLQEHVYSAEYGGASNQVNVSTKSGTNQFHGSAFEFLRNDAFDARNFFDGPTISPLRQSQYGYMLSGPVLVPKLYNGRNKSFFLANYEATRVRSSGLAYYTVPTPDQLNGVFKTTIADPLTGVPYPNGTIPTTLFSRVGTQFAKQIGLVKPNVTDPKGNYVVSRGNPYDSDEQTYRWDQYFGEKNQFFGRYTSTEGTSAGYERVGEESHSGANVPTKSLSLGFTRTLSSSVVNQFRFGWLDQMANSFGQPASKATLDALGLKGNFQGIPGTVYPSIGLNGYGAFGGSQFNPGANGQNSWEFSDSLSLNRGQHTITLGANFRHYSLFDTPSGGFYGDWTYSASFSGDAVADMLLGDVALLTATLPSYISTKPANTTAIYYYLAPFVQDDWKISQRLTVNLGLRYDFSSLPSEVNGLNAWWDYSNKAGGMCISNKSIIDKGLGSDVYRYCGATAGTAPKHVFAPRFGFAYRPFNDNKTVIRSGYGVFFDSTEREQAGSQVYYPYGVGINLVGTPGSVYVKSDDQFPTIHPGPAVRSDVLSFVFAGPPKTVRPYSQQWTFSIQRELNKTTVLEATYLGTKGTHLLARTNINQPSAYDPANPGTIAARRPYPEAGTILSGMFDLNSNYNALTVKLTHQTGDLNLMANYAWSKSIDNKSAASSAGSDQGWGGVSNNYDLGYDRGVSSFDVTHRLVAEFVYDLPFGHGKRFLPHLNKVTDLALGGWQLNGIANFQTGQPYSIQGFDESGLLGLSGAYMLRADQVGDPNKGFKKSLNEWFNTAAFQNPGPGLYGTSGRNILRSPGSANWDMSLFKNIPLHGERARLQLRGEAFNAFNHTQFGGPGNYMTQPTFGMVTGANAGRIIQVAGKFLF